MSALAASVQKEKEGQEDEVKQEHLVDNDDKEPVPSEPPQEQSTPVPIIVKRGRGRPRKYPRNRNVIHPVKLAKVMKSEGSSMEDGEAKESNHLNKTEPQVILTEKNSDGSSLNKTDPGPAKRGRGRPRKDQSLNSLTPRKPSYSSANDLEENGENLHQLPRPSTNISESKTRLRGRPRKMNYLHVQKMWTPKTQKEITKKYKKTHKFLGMKIPGIRGRPRKNPLQNPHTIFLKGGKGRPRHSYNPEHIRQLLEKKSKMKKLPAGFRGRPTKLEALKMKLEDRRHKTSDSHTSTNCTSPTPEQDSSEEANEFDFGTAQLNFPLEIALKEVHYTKGGASLENKENLLFVKSKALCDNRKLKEKLLERNDPVFREMKYKIRQELKKELTIKIKPPVMTNPNHVIRRRGPRGPYKKTLLAAAAAGKTSPHRKILPREPEKDYERNTVDNPIGIDEFMRANNLTSAHKPFIKEPIHEVLKNPFSKPVSKNIVVKKNPFNTSNPENVVKRKRGRPRKNPLPSNENNHLNHTFPRQDDCINLVSSDEEDQGYTDTLDMNYTYPMVENEPIGYDDDDTPYNPLYANENNDVSISLISDDED